MMKSISIRFIYLVMNEKIGIDFIITYDFTNQQMRTVNKNQWNTVIFQK